MKVNCVDISTWNTGVNYRAVRSDGVEAAILRAGYGRDESQIDSQFETHYRGCRDAGLKIGIYWYSYADCVADAEQEARACLAILNGRAIDLPVYFDMEEAWQTSLATSTLTAMAERFCETIKAGGYRAGVYSNLNWFYNYLDYDYLKSRYSIWLAQWSGSYSLECDIWQNSETGDISGINGNCDTNVIINWDILGGGSAPVDPDEQYDILNPSDADRIREVQRWLNDNFGAELDVDGEYGPLTNAALVRALQTVLNREYGAQLAVDGIFGRQTKKSIVNLERGAYGDYVRVLQGFLICRGHDTGGFDGDFGGRTESAVKTFQSVRGLYVDGIAGKATFEELTG